MNEIIEFLIDIKELLNDIKMLLEVKRQDTKKEVATKKKTEEKKATQETVVSVFQAYTKDETLLQSLLDFAEMRKKARSPLTVRAAEMQLRTLDELAKTTTDKITLIERSTMNGWKSIYPISGNSGGAVKQTTFTNYEQRNEDYDSLDFKILQERMNRKGV